MAFAATMFMLGAVGAGAFMAGVVMSIIGLGFVTAGFWILTGICVGCGYLVSRREGY